MFDGEHVKSQGSKALNFVLSLVLMFLLVLGISEVLRTFVLGMYYIPSGSMEETIMTGDYVLGEKISYQFREPESGDIVTFRSPELNSQLLIKRVVATSGQIVNFSDGKLVVDGVEQDEPYTNGKESEAVGNLTYPYTVPEGYVFVMGDNRTNSRDSRFIGPIEVSKIEARAVLIYWPISDVGTL